MPNQQNIARDDEITVTSFPIRLLTIAFVLTIVSFASFGWIIFDSVSDAKMFREKLSRIEELRRIIVHLDEVLTMSARMGAETGDSRLEERYRHLEPRLDAAIKEAKQLCDNPADIEALSRMEEANIKLEKMEDHVFALIRNARMEEARAVLFSPEYETQKSIYSEGVTSFVHQISRELDEDLQRDWRINLFIAIAALIVCGISFLAWFSAMRSIQRWRVALERSIGERIQAEQALRGAHTELEARVQQRTAELATTNKVLQEENTERKHAEEEMRESNEKFHQLADNITDAFWIRSPDMRQVKYISPAFERIWGRSAESLSANPQQWGDFILPEDRERVLRVFAAITGDTPSLDIEYRIVRPNDEIRWVRARGFQVRDDADKLISITGIVTDITEHKRAEQALQQSEARTKAIVQSSLDCIVTIDHEGKILEFNPAAEIVFGYLRSKVLGMEMAEAIIPPSFREQHRKGLARFLATGEAKVLGKRIEIVAMRSDGSEFPVELAITRLGAEEPPMFTGFIRDITHRKRSEQALKESEARYRSLFDANPFPMWVYDLETLAFLEVNDAAVAHYGYQREEFLSMTIVDIRPHVDTPKLLEHIARAAGHVMDDAGVWTHRKKDGSLITVEITSHVLDYSGRPAELELALDITERKRAGDALQERVRLAALEADVGTALTRGGTLAEMLRLCSEAIVLHLDAAFARIWTLNEEEGILELQASAGMYTHLNGPHGRVPIGKFKIGMIAKEQKPHLTNHVVGDPLVGDQEWAKREGMVAFAGYPLLVEDRLVGVIAMFARHTLTDTPLEALASISNNIAVGIERKRAAEELRESERRFSDMLRNLELVSMMLDRDAHMTYCNDYLLELTGWKRQEVIGRNWFEVFLPPEIIDEARGVHSALLADDPLAWHHENEIVTRSGARLLIRWNNSVLRSASGDAIGTASIGEDITERKRLEAQLFQAQKMETVGKLAGGVAHEFNSILTAVIGQSELLLGDLPLGSPLTKNAVEIRKAADRAAILTRQLLAYGRKQILEPETLDLNHIIAGMESMFHHLMGENVDVRIVLAARLHLVKADAGQIEQVIVNMAINAGEAMPNGGKLTLETANVTINQDSVGRYPELKPGDYVMLAISNTGKGMSEEVKARVFEPFFTTKSVGQGTGLGLATCYGIIKQSGGHINVYSEPNQGATFKIYLPQVSRPAETQPQLRDSAGLPRGTEMILLVEDDPALREMAAELLRRLGYDILTAENGVHALSLIEQRGEESIDLLFTDVVMPRLSGKELSDRLLASHPKTKTLFTSAFTENAIVHQGILDAGVALLQKPFTPSALAFKVREVLDHV